MEFVKDKGKWLIAFAACLCCLVLCASMMVAPTLAEEAGKTSETESTSATTTTTALESSTETTTVPAKDMKYKVVTGYTGLYEILNADGTSKAKPEYIFSATTPKDGQAAPAVSVQALVLDNKYYIPFPEGSGIFLALKADGTFDFSNALFWGKDKTFGTEDDVRTSVREEGGFYFWKQAEEAWEIIKGVLNPANTTTSPDNISSTTSPEDASSTTGEDESSSTTNGFFTTESLPDNHYPKTGLTLSPGVMACMALLLMGCIYCIAQVLRRKTYGAR